jgi:hypothetical protein
MFTSRFIIQTLLLLSICSQVCCGQSPSDVVNDYFAALKSKDKEKLVSLIDSKTGSRLGRAVKASSEIFIDRNDKLFVPVVIGVDATKQKIQALSASEACTLFLFAIEKEKSAFGVEVSDPKVVGEVKEGDDITHLVYRLDHSAQIPRVEASTAQLLTCVRENRRWHVCISNETMSQYYQMINLAMEKSATPEPDN